jgi:hypothetical protein
MENGFHTVASEKIFCIKTHFYKGIDSPIFIQESLFNRPSIFFHQIINQIPQACTIENHLDFLFSTDDLFKFWKSVYFDAHLHHSHLFFQFEKPRFFRMIYNSPLSAELRKGNPVYDFCPLIPPPLLAMSQQKP